MKQTDNETIPVSPAMGSLIVRPPRERGDISQDETVAIASGETRQVALVRYQLRATLHRIISDCERLLGEKECAARDAWREGVGRALLDARQILTTVERTSPSEVLDRSWLSDLYTAIAEPQRRVVAAMSGLLTLIPTGIEEELMQQDVRQIRDVAIRLAPGSEPAPAAPALPQGNGAAPASERHPRILVVDDEEQLRKALSRLLQRLGYDITAAKDGREALEIAGREAPDLIITDITMPELDGYELLARLKSSDATRHIPVIVVSGMNDIHSVVRCIEQGAEDHLTKPYETVVLQARIRASLERKRMRDQELAYLRRVAQITAAAEAVDKQAYDSQSLATLSTETDELGQLARVFDRMVSGIRSREGQLQNRLRELRREIRQATGPGRASGAISNESPFIAGQVLADRYEIREELGKGGMGMVYLAHDRQLAEDVAVKVVRSELVGQDPNLVERLKSEIRLTRRISHRNVVRAHDLGEWQGVYFLTMEYVKGISVGTLIETRGRLTVESTLAIGSQLADALAVAHEQEIIHRDIKPHNLLVDEEGVLKVMDFGLARLVQRTGELTQAGFVVGTPRYMAPEQLFGSTIDARSDLFAVGVVLYECLTGRPPFEASSPIAVIARMLEGHPPDVRGIAPDVSPALADLVERLLQRDPKDRPSSARDLAERLAQIGQGA